MKFRNETLGLGMRFYKFESDEDYRILALVKLNGNDTAVFMDEETFELHTITKDELENEYTLLSNSLPFAVAGFEFGSKKTFQLFFNEEIVTFIKDNLYSLFNESQYKLRFNLIFRVYSYMKKAVFDKTVNYILTLNNLYSPLEKNLNTIWNMYFSYMHKSTYVDIIDNHDNIDMEEVVNNKAKLPDSVFDKAEDYLNTYILSYEVYRFDASVNIDNVNMKYFFIYDADRDEYYIVLYVIDTTRIAMETVQLMEENKDVVQFMLGQN